MPVVGPKTAAELQAYIAHNPAPLPTEEQVEEMLGLLANAMKDGKSSREEAKARMAQYYRGLRDVPLSALHFAYDRLLKTKTFFPSIPEIIEAAAGSPSDEFTTRRNVARTLLMKHGKEWREPVELIGDDDKALVAETLAALTAKMSVGGSA